MKTVNQYTVDFPEWALSAIINGDYSGIESDEDCKLVEEWEKENPGIYGYGDCESYFTWRPEFGLACNCVELTVTQLEVDQ